jgi:hypothetical protein
MAVNEEKYKAFQELIARDIKFNELTDDYYEELDSAYHQLTGEIKCNTYQFENRDLYKKYLDDRLFTVIFSMYLQRQFYERNCHEIVLAIGIDNYKKRFKRLEEIRTSAIQYKKDLLRIENKAVEANVKPAPKTEQKGKKSYSLRQVCISYHFMGGITEKNGAKLLKLHTRFKSVPKLLQKVITKASDLTTLSENKTTDTKHLNDLKAAKRLISGKKNKEALKRITHTITQFQTAYGNHY